MGGAGGRAWRWLVPALLPGLHLFLNQLLDRPDHIFKTALEHIGFSSLPVVARACWK